MVGVRNRKVFGLRGIRGNRRDLADRNICIVSDINLGGGAREGKYFRESPIRRGEVTMQHRKAGPKLPQRSVHHLLPQDHNQPHVELQHGSLYWV